MLKNFKISKITIKHRKNEKRNANEEALIRDGEIKDIVVGDRLHFTLIRKEKS